MIAEFRTYIINRGMIDSYLDLFNNQIVPNHRQWGMEIIGAWVEKRTNRVTWIRLFKDEEDRAEKVKAYEEGPDRVSVMPVASYHVAGVEVKIMYDVFDPASAPDKSPLETLMAQQAYAAYKPTQA